jgi:7-carboxy-7-deazaguanine synthase
MPLIVCETFVSLLGEGTRAGERAFFIRLTGCNLRCRYCDTTYAYEEGQPMAVAAILEVARLHSPRLALVTGGEPLLQADTGTLLDGLLGAGFEVFLETNGSLSIAGIDPRVHRILDVKCPGSGMAAFNDLGNLNFLTSGDEIKFVVSDRLDFDWALEIIREHRLVGRLPLLISPVFGQVPPPEAAAWIIASNFPLRLNLQLHKCLWGPEARGV